MSTYQEILLQISELQKQADTVKASEQASVIADIREKIEVYGLTADDLGLGNKALTGKKAGAPGIKVPVRYRDSSGNTWTGRGKRPGWLTAALNSGKNIEEFRIS